MARCTLQLLCRDGGRSNHVRHLFERFYRGRRTAQSTTPGTGLGLAIVKEIIEAQGGQIEVVSQPGQDSIFRIWLPIAKTRQQHKG